MNSAFSLVHLLLRYVGFSCFSWLSLFLIFQNNLSFLALLDYVSRAYEIKIRASSIVHPSVRPSSVWSINYL